VLGGLLGVDVGTGVAVSIALSVERVPGLPSVRQTASPRDAPRSWMHCPASTRLHSLSNVVALASSVANFSVGGTRPQE
jgi:hypothetical protein